MSFAFIALAVMFSAWAICGGLAWLVFSVATRGHAGLGMLPLSIFVACVFGPLVPILGFDDGRGLVLSFLAALLGPAGLLALRRFAMPVAPLANEHPAEAE